ncbi:MAG: indolepyruvate oxidoreductase subunit beta family protein [Acidobacteriota bacterium]
MHESIHPTTLLISAIGGEGGGVLMKWIVNAAVAQGFPVQGTSVPGVAQRTGATTYYIEIFPVRLEELNGRMPVLSLYPCVGDIDVVVASELIEAGRMMERGFVQHERTTLIGSSHRVYSIAEKMPGREARFDSQRVIKAAQRMARQTLLFDAKRAARDSGSVLNAVLLGAIAASGRLPLEPSALEESIRAAGKAVSSNLAGFACGLARGAELTDPDRDRVESPAKTAPPEIGETIEAPVPAALGDRLLDYPLPCLPILRLGVSRLIDYQDTAYAGVYLDRLDTIRAAACGDGRLISEAARQLALWMSYEDAIRVAQLKTQRVRFEKIRNSVGAGPGEVVRVTDFLKPGLEEFSSLLPAFAARPLLRWAESHHWMEKLEIPLHIKTSTISGFMILWTMARLRPLRRLGHRFRQEQAMIENWLHLVRQAATLDLELAQEVVQCARLIRGYGATHRNGVAHFQRIIRDLIEPALAGNLAATEAVAAVAESRQAALAATPAGQAVSGRLPVIQPRKEVESPGTAVKEPLTR